MGERASKRGGGPGEPGKGGARMSEPVGTLLWEMRAAAGFSLGELARRAGLSKATLSQWESGQRQPRVAELEATLRARLDISCLFPPGALAWSDAENEQVIS